MGCSMRDNDRPIGRVVGWWRYPVKSMAAEALPDIDVGWHGLAGDRRWAFVRNGVAQSGFPWFTLRNRGDLNHYRPSFVDPQRPDKSPTVVRTPSGAVLDVTDPALAAELYPGGVRVIRQDRGIFDTFPLSVITTQTIERLGMMVGTRLDVRRFRPNILVESTTDERRHANPRRQTRCSLRCYYHRSSDDGTKSFYLACGCRRSPWLPRRLRHDRRARAARSERSGYDPRGMTAVVTAYIVRHCPATAPMILLAPVHDETAGDTTEPIRRPVASGQVGSARPASAADATTRT